MRSLLTDAAQRAIQYLEDIQERRVAPDETAIRELSALREALPEHPCEPQETLTLLDTVGSPATMGIAGRRFFGFVIGGALPVTVASNWLATAWDQNPGLRVASPVNAVVEDVALMWLRQLLRLPESTGAGFVTGATVANTTALAAARHALLEKSGWDVGAQGMFGAPPVDVIIGEEAHPSVARSLALLGLGRDRCIQVPVDDQGCMRADVFPELKNPSIVCTQVGNVNTGGFDPVGDICNLARKSGSWVHVDGAFGLWAAASPRHAHLVAGMEAADSWATDAHKWLNVPYDSGLAFVKHPEHLRNALSLTASYLPTTTLREPSHYTPELSRRSRGVDVWAAIRTLGRSGIAAMIDRCCRHADHFAAGLRKGGCEILNDVVLNQVLVSFGDASMTLRVIAALQEDGTCWVGGTEWQGQTAMRISVSSWATTEEDVDRSIATMLRVAKQVRAASRSAG
jgi:glutamate/tyrosine decarboxylase-like PLP-dependent enzyme